MQKTERRAEATWYEPRLRWEIKVQKDGSRKTFTSSTPGKKGKHAAELKADEWLRSTAVLKKLAPAWEAYLSQYRKDTSESAYIKHEVIWRKWIKPNIKKGDLAGITPMDWQKCVDAAADAGRSKKTCENIRGTITSFCRFARKNRWKLEVPLSGEIAIPKHAKRGKRRILQPSGLKTLFTIDSIEHYNKLQQAFYIHAWRFLVVTGLRRGETVALETADKVEKDRVIYVHKSVNNIGEVTNGKNENAERYVALADIALTILNDQRAMLKRMGIISPYIFPDKNGGRSNPNSLYKAWYTYRNQHGLTCSLHELRHTFVSLVKSDMPKALLKEQVGHSEETDTIGIYGHYVENDVLATAKIIDDVFSRLIV